MVTSSAGKMIAAFVLLIIGIVLLAQIADMGQDVTEKTQSGTETFALATNGSQLNITGMENADQTISNVPTSWKIDDCPITDFVLKNASGSEVVEDTDYVFDEATGVFSLTKTLLTNSTFYPINVSLATYTYCGDDYMNLSWGRTGINLVPGFFAIALLLMSVGLFYSIAKENGIIN